MPETPAQNKPDNRKVYTPLANSLLASLGYATYLLYWHLGPNGRRNSRLSATFKRDFSIHSTRVLNLSIGILTAWAIVRTVRSPINNPFAEYDISPPEPAQEANESAVTPASSYHKSKLENIIVGGWTGSVIYTTFAGSRGFLQSSSIRLKIKMFQFVTGAAIVSWQVAKPRLRNPVSLPRLENE